MQESARSTFSVTQKDALLDQVKIIIDAGEVAPRSDSADLRWDSACDRLAMRYGWHLDDWKRLGRDQMGQPCGRGWVGLRGACKRGKKSEDNTAKIKESKVALADKIRAKKGLRDRNDPKVVAQKSEDIDVKKIAGLDGNPSSFLTSTENGEISIDAVGMQNPTWAQNNSGITVSGNKSRKFNPRGDIYSMRPEQFKSFIEKVRKDDAYNGIEEFRLGYVEISSSSRGKASLKKLKDLESAGLISLTGNRFDGGHGVFVNFDSKGKMRKATDTEIELVPLRLHVSRLRKAQSEMIGREHSRGSLSKSDLDRIRNKETVLAKDVIEAEDKLYGRKNTKTATEADYITKAENWAKSQGFKNDGDGVNGFSARQAAKHDIAHPATHDLVGLDSAGIHSYFGGLKTGSGKKSLLGEEAIVNVVEHLSRGDTLESSVMSGTRVARMLSRDSTKQEKEYVRSPKFLQDLNNLGEKALKADNFGTITKVVRESNWESGTVTRAGNV